MRSESGYVVCLLNWCLPDSPNLEKGHVHQPAVCQALNKDGYYYYYYCFVENNRTPYLQLHF